MYYRYNIVRKGLVTCGALQNICFLYPQPLPDSRLKYGTGHNETITIKKSQNGAEQKTMEPSHALIPHAWAWSTC